MNEAEFENWVDAYIDAYSNNRPPGETDQSYWAIEKFVDLEADQPELCWKALLRIVEKLPSDRILANLSAGPLEELLELHGKSFIDQIEKEARSNPIFKELLQGVWETTDRDIWARILRARTDD